MPFKIVLLSLDMHFSTAWVNKYLLLKNVEIDDAACKPSNSILHFVLAISE